MKRYHQQKEDNKRKKRSKFYNNMFSYIGPFGERHEISEGRCHSKSPFDCGRTDCNICSSEKSRKYRSSDKNKEKTRIAHEYPDSSFNYYM